MFSPPSVRNLYPTKTVFSEFFFPKNKNDVLVTSSCLQELTQITETKNRTNRMFWKTVFLVGSKFHQTSLKTKLQKNCACNGVWSVQEERTSSSLEAPLRFWCDYWQKLTNAFWNLCKRRKRSQRASLRYT